MVKMVIGEETRLSSTEDRLSQSAIAAEVGLVIGKLSSCLDRGFVYDLIPTPSNDAGEPACTVVEARDDSRKPSKSKSQPSDFASLAIDYDWVAEHARQVSRMLLGGMNVVGVYIWASSSTFKNSTEILCQAIKGVAEATRCLDFDLAESLLVHICYSPRRWNCRSCTLNLSMASCSLRPCDFKMGRVLNSLKEFRCNYNVSFRLPMCHEGESTAIKLTDILRHELLVHVKELMSAQAMIDGELVVNDELPGTDGERHQVELLFPFMKDAGSEACSIKDVVGILIFSGNICSYAYLNSKEPVSEAVVDIKADIVRSLQSRLDIICDEAAEDVDPTNSHDQEEVTEISKPSASNIYRKSCRLRFPRRVLVPWLAGTFVCDYLQPSDSLKVVRDHCAELMSIEVGTLPDESSILEVEAESSAPMISRSFWDSASSVSNFSSDKSLKNTRKPEINQRTVHLFSWGILSALLILVLSIILGFVFYVPA